MLKKPSHDNCLLKQVEKLEFEAREFGFYWEHFSQLIEQIQSECTEVQEAWHKGDRVHLKEEVGDLLLAAISLAVYCEFDPHETLLENIHKFQKRYKKVVELAQRDGHTHLRKQPTDVLMKYWNSAKLDK